MCLTSDRNRFLLDNGGLFEDVPRSVDGAALIADPRNDGNLIISGLQAALLKFQNSVMDLVEAGSLPDQAAFAEAQRLVRWHWRWLIVREFLPQFVGQATIDDVLERTSMATAWRTGRTHIACDAEPAPACHLGDPVWPTCRTANVS